MSLICFRPCTSRVSIRLLISVTRLSDTSVFRNNGDGLSQIGRNQGVRTQFTGRLYLINPARREDYAKHFGHGWAEREEFRTMSWFQTRWLLCSSLVWSIMRFWLVNGSWTYILDALRTKIARKPKQIFLVFLDKLKLRVDLLFSFLLRNE